MLQLDDAAFQAARADDELPGQADQIHLGEFLPGAFLAVVVQRLGFAQLCIEIGANPVGVLVANLEIDQPDPERRHRLGPDDAVIVVAGLDNTADQSRNADAVGAHLHRRFFAVGAGDYRAQGLGILVAEEENMTDLDAARLVQAVLRDGTFLRVMLLVGRGVQRLQGIYVDIVGVDFQIVEGGVVENLAFAGIGEYLEFMAQIATDRAGIGAHRYGLQAHPREGLEIGDEHLVVGHLAGRGVDVERVGVLHQELAPAHHAEPRPHFVAELPLNVIKVLRQVLVALHRMLEDICYKLFICWTIKHLPIMPVGDPQHLLAVILVAPRVAPQVGRLDGRHEHFLGAGGVLFLAHDLLDLLQHAQAQRQPGIDPGAGLADHAGAQHQAVRDDLRLRRGFPQGRHKEFG